MSKALYHVPQPGEKIRFKEISGLYTTEIVKSWDVKHGVLTTCEGDRYRIENRWTIKLVAPAPTATPKPVKVDAPAPVADAPEPRPRTEEHLFRDTTATIDLSALAKERGNIEFVPATAPYTTTLPTSFASEVERAQAIADAEAEETKRHEGSLEKYEELAHKIAALIKEQSAVAVEDANAQQDHENRLEYLRSLRVRQDR